MRRSAQQRGVDPVDFDDDVGGEVRAPSRFADGLWCLGLVQAVAFAFVAGEEGCEPADFLVGVDGPDRSDVLAIDLDLLGEVRSIR